MFYLFQIKDECEPSAGESVQHYEELFCTLSEVALSGAPVPKTMCLLSTIQGYLVNILIDSGSSHSFISSRIAELLHGVFNAPSPMFFKVSNGEELVLLPHVEWQVGDVSFVSDLRVLNLSSCDMIVELTGWSSLAQ